MEGSSFDSMKAIEQAIRAEIEGQHFYRMAARSTEDPKGREVFERLADDEALHEKFLRALRDSIASGEGPDRAPSLGQATAYGGKSPIFSDALRARIRSAHFEMTALSIGIQLELGAASHYKRMAGSSADPALRRTFEELAGWESGHYQALLQQQEELKGDYWSGSGFAPY